MAFVWPFRLEGPLEPGGGGGAAGEGVRIARGLLQTQIPRPARQVSSLCPSSCTLTPCKPPANPLQWVLQLPGCPWLPLVWAFHPHRHSLRINPSFLPAPAVSTPKKTPLCSTQSSIFPCQEIQQGGQT